MKYEEYQIWYHVYTSIAPAVSKRAESVSDICKISDSIAQYAVDKFKQVENLPEDKKSSVDLSGLVEKVLKDSLNKKQ
jgi:hypothetical protein